MKRWLKIGSVIAAVVVALVVALIILASVLITPERVKSTLLPLAEQQLHRKIELGEIGVSLLSGIEIHGLRVYEADGREIFLSAELVRLRYQLLPLLAMKVVVDEVLLDKPSIRVVRLKDGRFNFSDLTASAAPGKETASPEPQDGGTPISLLVSQVLLQGGQVVFHDHVLNDRAPYRYEITDLQVAAKGVSLVGAVPLSLSCRVNGSRISLDGQVTLLPLGGTFQAEVEKLDAVPFTPYFQAALPGKLNGMTVNVKASVAGTAEEVKLKGTLTLDGLDLVLDALPEAPIKNARFAAGYDLLFNTGQQRLDLQQLDLDYNGIKVNSKGSVTDVESTPQIALSVQLPGLQLGQALAALPQALAGDLLAFDPTGAVTVEAILAGRADDGLKLLKSAAVDLDNVQATAGGQRPAFSGRLNVDGDNVTSKDLAVRLGDNNAAIALQARRIFSRPIVVKADISSERFLLEPLLAGSAAPAAAANQSKAASRSAQADEELGPFDIPLQASGTIKVAETVWKGLAIKDFLAQYELKDNILTLSRIDGQVAGGSFSNSARVDLGRSGLAYTADLGIKAVQADPLLSALAPKATGSLQGAMDLTLSLAGRGTQWPTLSRNLNGKGSMQLADGRLISPGLVGGLGSALQLPELKDIRFDDFVGQFQIVDGKVLLDSRMLSEALKLFPKGTVGLDGALNLALDTRLSPALSQKMDSRGGITRYLADDDGWTRVPLLLKGNFAAPSFGLDPKGVQEQASKALGNELGRQLDKLFKQPAPQPTDGQTPAGGSQPAEDPGRQMLQDSLKKLFGN